MHSTLGWCWCNAPLYFWRMALLRSMVVFPSSKMNLSSSFMGAALLHEVRSWWWHLGNRDQATIISPQGGPTLESASNRCHYCSNGFPSNLPRIGGGDDDGVVACASRSSQYSQTFYTSRGIRKSGTTTSRYHDVARVWQHSCSEGLSCPLPAARETLVERTV